VYLVYDMNNGDDDDDNNINTISKINNNWLNDLIWREMSKAGLPSIKEPQGSSGQMVNARMASH